jgi:hypothetical protein
MDLVTRVCQPAAVRAATAVISSLETMVWIIRPLYGSSSSNALPVSGG